MILFRNTAFIVTSVVIFIGSPGLLRAEVTLKGSLVCNGACVPTPKAEDHVMVLFAIDGTAEIRAEMDRIVNDFLPEQGLDAEAAQKLLEQFDTRLKYYIAPDSPALKNDKNRDKNHYCHAARAIAVSGDVVLQGEKKWITADKIEPTLLKYPDRLLAADKPFMKSVKEPLTLKINDKLAFKCVYIPPGRFLMGTLYCLWPYYQEEYPHAVTLTKLRLRRKCTRRSWATTPVRSRTCICRFRTPPSPMSRSSAPSSRRKTRRPSACLPTRNGSTQPG
jgi:hypothetical protein